MSGNGPEYDYALARAHLLLRERTGLTFGGLSECGTELDAAGLAQAVRDAWDARRTDPCAVFDPEGPEDFALIESPDALLALLDDVAERIAGGVALAMLGELRRRTMETP